MWRWLAIALGVTVCVAATGLLLVRRTPDASEQSYRVPTDATVTLFRAQGVERTVLNIEAATDVSFSRPFIRDFQAAHPNVTVRYADFLSSTQFARAQQACAEHGPTADLYLSVSTDNLVKLANDGCAATLPKSAVRDLPAWAHWRHNVVAFSLEPAVFVYNTRVLAKAPADHLELIEMLRADPNFWRGRIGTYDIEASGAGYLYAGVDAHQSATYGRLIESFGRSAIRIYCCSNEMADAVARGDILLAYNVQMSYAAAAKRQGKAIGVVVPSDYQAIQTRSVMVTRDARQRETAIAFIQYLTSPRGQAVAARQFAPFTGPTVERNAPVGGQLSPIPVSPVLLGQADQARRRQFIREWTNAVRYQAVAN